MSKPANKVRPGDLPAAFLSTIEEVVEDARNGRMFILIDEEDRENEGDLIIPAQMATPEAINFMAKHGRGLICLTLTSHRVKELDLPLMSRENLSRQGTAFTISIEAKEGVDLTTLQPEARSAAATAQTVFAEFGLTAVVTSTGPGDRKKTKSVKGTKHDIGQALDLRTRSIPKKMLAEVVAALKLALGDDYDVVLEKDHIHVEFDPKKPE